MSEPLQIALVGATGLVGRSVMEVAVGRSGIRLLALARRAVELPQGAKMDMIVAPTDSWPIVLERQAPAVLVCALGTTIGKQQGDRDAFRAVDYDLIVDTARAAHAAGVKRCVVVSTVNADSGSRLFYAKVKGETEDALRKIGFDRLDLVRPGLLRGKRQDDPRALEKMAMLVSPFFDPFLQGAYSAYRSIVATTIAEAALGLALRKAAGTFVHENKAIHREANYFCSGGEGRR